MKRIAKKWISFFLAVALVLSVLPIQMISYADSTDTATAEESGLFNLLSGNSEFRHITNWGKVAVNNDQLNLDNGKYVYYGYTLNTETVSYTVNHNGITTGNYLIYLHTASTDGSALADNGPIIIRYDFSSKEFWMSSGKTSLDSNSAMAKMSVDMCDSKDHTVEIITTQNTTDEEPTTTIQIRVDGTLLTDSKNNNETYWTFDGVNVGGYICFARYVSNQPITLKGLYIDGVTYDPYYTESFTADFEDETADTLTITNPSSGPGASISTAAAHSGTNSIYFDDTSSTKSDVKFALDSSARALRPGITYRVTAWVMVKNTTGTQQITFKTCKAATRNSTSGSETGDNKGLKYWSINNNWVTVLEQSTDVNTSGTWYKVLITSNYTVDSDSTSVFPYVCIYPDGNGTGWYIDDVAFEAVMENPPAASENGAYGTVSYKNYLRLNSASGSVDTVAVCVGDSVTATATANEGYYFTGWYAGDTCVSTSENYTYITDGTTIYARFGTTDELCQDFENTPNNYSITNSSVDNATVGITNDEAMSGSKSLQIKTTSGSASVQAALFDGSNGYLQVGSTYRATMWVKFNTYTSSNLTLSLYSMESVNDASSSAKKMIFKTESFNKDKLNPYYTGKTGVQNYGVDSNSATGWYEACITDYFVADCKYAKLYAWVPQGVELYIDDIVFTKVNTVTATVEADSNETTHGQVSASNEFTYQALNASEVKVSAGVVDGKEETVHLTALADVGYVFNGWYLRTTDDSGEEKDTLASSDTSYDVVKPEESVTYIAKFVEDTGSASYDTITQESIISTLLTGDADAITNEQFLTEALLSAGNSDRVAAAMQKAASGEDITIGFIGGSITEGVGASTNEATGEKNSWARAVYDWFVENFPSCNVHYVNAAIAGSYSKLGVTYTETDLMSKHPDIVFLDYSVNDYSGYFKDSYETIIRTILAADNMPGLVMMDFTQVYTEGSTEDIYSYTNQEAIYDALGVYYELPIINIEHALEPFLESEYFKWSNYSDDSIHPNDNGHAMVAASVIHYLKSAKAYSETNMELIPTVVKENWYYGASELAGALMSYAGEIKVESEGFTLAENEVSRFGWDAYNTSTSGSTLTFTLKDCKEVVIVYGQSNAVTPSDMKITVNGYDYMTKSPSMDSTPWCVDNICSVDVTDMVITITTIENSICNIAGVYAAIDSDTADAVRELRTLLSEYDLDTAEAQINGLKDKFDSDSENYVSDDVTVFVANASDLITEAEAAVSDIKAIVYDGNDKFLPTVEVYSKTAKADVITLISGIDATQYKRFISGGFDVSSYGITVINGENAAVKKDTDTAKAMTYSGFGRRTVFETCIQNVTGDRQSAELTARAYVTYMKGNISVTVYNASETMSYSALSAN